MTPQHAKFLLRALSDNIRKYEATFGEINIDGPIGKLFEGFDPGNPKVN